MNTSFGNYSYNGSSYSPVPPEIQNKTGLVPQTAADGTNFFNHSFGNWSDIVCKTCHSANPVNSTTQFIHNVTSGGGGSDCRSCHDTNGNGAPFNKRVDISDFNKSVHNRLNGGGNRACWACHGDGTEPGGHPPQYKSPRKCSDDNCHSLNQSYRAPMIYSHFKNASLNNNINNALNFNVTVSNNCEDCHIQSVINKGNTIKSTVSHYGILESLPDTRNCIYCHLNKDNSEKWGNATRININRTSLVELDRINNKFTVKAGESAGLGSRFELKVLEISNDRIALIELFKDDVQVDRSAVSLGNYTYEETLIIENSSLKVPVIVLNFTGFFYSGNISFVQFEGFRTKRVHSENKSTFCYQCHYYSRPKIEYRVIERVHNDIDDIYYTEELVNFSDKKQYDETDALRAIMNLTDTDFYIDINPVTRKPILEGEAWNISQDYTIKVKDTTKENDEAFIQLNIGNYSYEDIVKKGEYFEYEPKINYLGNQPKNVTIFRAKVSEIIHAKSSNLIILENVMALSMDIKKIEEKKTLFGYNTSWLWENSTLTAGKIPSDFHSPSLFDGKDGGGECLSCHGINGVSDKKVIALGKHAVLNGGGNRACYACHGGSVMIQNHPPGFRSPRKCISCHASTVDNYSAIYIGDEEHKNGVCENCHVTNIHTIQGFDVRPSVENISVITQDNKTIIRAFAIAGYKIKVMGARYYIDSPEETFMMYPEDGIFDSQKEEIVLTTYYPTPYGDYDRMRVNRISVGDTNGDGQRTVDDLPQKDGQIYIAESGIYKPKVEDPAYWANGITGELAFSNDKQKFYYFDKSSWRPLGGSEGGYFIANQCPAATPDMDCWTNYGTLLNNDTAWHDLVARSGETVGVTIPSPGTYKISLNSNYILACSYVGWWPHVWSFYAEGKRYPEHGYLANYFSSLSILNYFYVIETTAPNTVVKVQYRAPGSPCLNTYIYDIVLTYSRIGG